MTTIEEQAAKDYAAEREQNPSHAKSSMAEDVERLAKMPAPAYDLVREHHALELGIRLGTLDRMVAKRRKKLGLDDDKTPPPFPAVEPSPHPVAGDGLLHKIVHRLKQHVIFSDEAANAVALWIAFAWTHDAATHSPMLLVTSAERDTGKTTLLGLVNLLSPRGTNGCRSQPRGALPPG